MSSNSQPSAAELAEHLNAAAAEAEAAAANHQQAEAEAVAAVADPKAYTRAAEQAARAAAILTAARERAGRLRHAHQSAAAKEQEEYVARLETAHTAALAALDAEGPKLAEDRAAEEKRHQEAMEAIQRRQEAASAALANAKDALQNARHGLTETAAKRIAELTKKENRVRESYHRDLDQLVREADTRYREAKRRVAELGGHQGVSDDVLSRTRQEMATAGRILADQNRYKEQRDSEIAAIRTELEGLRSVLQSKLPSEPSAS